VPTGDAREFLGFRPTHRHLVAPLEIWGGDKGGSGPAAVVVPTARSSSYSRSGVPFAARLASSTGCPLVVITSKEAATTAGLAHLTNQVRAATHGAPPDGVVLQLSTTATQKTAFRLDELPISKAFRRGGMVDDERRVGPNDVGRKRNAALLLARSMGWRTLLFLDDDVFDRFDGRGRSSEPHVRTLDVGTLKVATAAVESGRHAAVGWALRDFDDNSVLCRIRSHLGQEQGQFLGGGALLVDVEADLPFFPAIYNEDWLFLLRLLAGNRLPAPVLDGGDVHQDAYDAFPATRAASEELGDLLGEGLLTVLETQGSDSLRYTSAHFWREAIRSRIRMREDLERQVWEARPAERDSMIKALDAVKGIHERLVLEEKYWVNQLRAYVDIWHEDLAVWRRRLYRDTPPRPATALTSHEFVGQRTVTMGRVGSVAGFSEMYGFAG
jgi:hypothetical protein